MNRLSRLAGFLYILAIGMSSALYSCSSDDISKTEPPNIILIMADDLGYGGIGCFGNTEINTPALDRMAAQGLRLTDYHSNGSVCSPTRAALLTGKYQQRSGLEGVIYARGPTREVGLDTNIVSVAKALKQAGYQTMISGKWHLGYRPAYNPIYHGFDEFFGYVSGNVDFHSHYDNTGVFDWYHNLDTLHEDGYVTDLITDHALEFIEVQQSSPFFLYVSHEAPHVPFQGRNDPPYRFADNEFSYYGPVTDRDRAYREMIEVMDEGIGKILDRLDQLGLSENTLVVFVSDNGAETFGHNGPLRGSKGSLFEGGHRVPAIVRWTGRIPSNTTSDATVLSFDWMPTFLALANLDASDLALDGIDLSDHLLNQNQLRSQPVFWRYRNELVVRQGSHKLMMTESDTLLFDLSSDLGEQTDLCAEQPKLVQLLKETAQSWEEEINDISQKTR